MKTHLQAEDAFNKKISELEKEHQPALYGHNLKEIVLYEKLLEIQEQIKNLTEEVNKKSIQHANGN